VHQGKTYKVKIPAGADDGTRIRYSEFDVTINVQDDKVFRRQGRDIFMYHELPLTLALLGGDTTVKTLDGELKIKIRSGTQPSTTIRLSGKGMPSLRGGNRGDLYIKLKVMFPEKLSGKAKKIVQGLAEELATP
jgi:DnaJ-class molecular chaperone